MFYLEKVISSILVPPGIIMVLIIIIGLISLKKAISPLQKMLSFSILIIGLFSYLLMSGIGTYLYVKPLETEYSVPNASLLDTAEAIVVLGGGMIIAPYELEPGDHTLKRLYKAFQIHRATGKPIIVTGGTPMGRDSLSESEVMLNTLLNWGIDENDVIVENSARNTNENAVRVAEICKEKKWKKIVLVTSAVHMKRSVESFEEQGLNVIPYPTDYLYDYTDLSWVDFLPGRDALTANLSGIHEFIGIIWYNAKR
ncbi:YdcF family protein [Kosmotoga olearia]|uniref:DUF218 domain-containing protein n=1 Tax=Kosmotoga olearia (strain ATCC BAA-1733 / DSM 21960 / TBF 19.5.1) TaxID=521045 RepID=C5CHG0_KOSOT|nr:YdcF family protein [Kosmotoga olearia]ACR79715.1 protein of unknown function DUF218 [Kosmotoga olearia TBF 19.5.1]MDK2954344.1 hypothetical protein [Kosmotoga sp.]